MTINEHVFWPQEKRARWLFGMKLYFVDPDAYSELNFMLELRELWRSYEENLLQPLSTVRHSFRLWNLLRLKTSQTLSSFQRKLCRSLCQLFGNLADSVICSSLNFADSVILSKEIYYSHCWLFGIPCRFWHLFRLKTSWTLSSFGRNLSQSLLTVRYSRKLWYLCKLRKFMRITPP